MIRRVLLDTNAFADFHRSGKWREVIRGADEVILPLIVVGELRFGFLNGSRPDKNEVELLRFLSKPSASVLFPDLETTREYATIHHQLKLQGTPIPQNDIWIAALALQHRVWLCTSDSHFDHLPQLLRAIS